MVAPASLELLAWLSLIFEPRILLFLLPKCWGYRGEPPRLTCKSIYLKSDIGLERWLSCYKARLTAKNKET